jgi:hypothetical protein
VTLPPNIEIGKYYYKKHVEDITQELNDALSLGQAAAEEWSKGLDDKGKERMKIADNYRQIAQGVVNIPDAPDAVTRDSYTRAPG